MPLLETRSRAPMWLWLVLLAAIASTMMRPVTVSAQAEGEPAAAEGAAAPAAEGGEPAAEGEGGEGEKQSTLWWIMETSGWIGAVLLIISIYFVALVVQLFLELREQVVCPPELMEQAEGLLKNRDYNGVYKLCKENTSELGQLIASGMAALSGGLADARESIDRLGETITVEMEKRISMLAVIGSLGPMIGLLGTLKGMIASFGTIAMSGTQMKASEVAGGISEALLITFEGVALSVPAIYFYAVFKNRVSTLSLMALNKADDFIRRVHATAQSKAPAAPAAQAPTA